MSPLTPNQQQAVECQGRALFIQAGAGTGKTFTLTKKLAYGLSAKSGPLLESVDNVLTITFTNKAAAELLGRVRAELRAQGLEDAALLIDGAWISTIHGMCNRILSAHALEAGIDPGMPLLSEEESSALLQQAVDEGLGSDAMEMLVEAFGPAGACALVSQLASLIEMAPAGVAEFSLGPQVQGDPVRSLRALAESLEGHLASLEELGVRESPSVACVKQLDRLELAIAVARDLIACDDLSWDAVAKELEDCAPPKGGALKKVFREDFAAAFDLVADIRAIAGAAQARSRLELALDLASQAAARHQELKRAGGVQDTNDLLMSTYKLLDANPHIAQEYRERFGSIMVDEFQDTDILQVRIVENFCDESLSTLTTVGDAQQSIYGFRGADLETYRAMRAQMQQAGSLEVSLDINYRSHPDILAFVESIFSKSSFFGEEFLRISAGPANARDYSWAVPGQPRVTMYLASGQKADSGRAYTSVADLREAEARFIADRFEELAAKGALYGQMAILMSSTKQAGPYLAALRQRGIPCAVSGGSDFYLQPEVLVCTALLRVLELPDDDQPLLAVLASPLFDISDGDLLSLRIVAKRELRNPGPFDARPKVSLFDAMAYQVGKLPYNGADPLVRAYQILSDARAQLGHMPLSNVVAGVLERCGWLEELRGGGAAGLAVAANVNRFIDLVAQFESEHGPSAVGAGEHFRMMCDMAQEGAGAKGKPGRMVALGNDSVQVMTIHASKGLEFPIVAVAQYARSSHAQSGKEAVVLTEGGGRYMTLPATYTGEGAGDVKAHAAECASYADNLESARDALGFGGYALRLNAAREDEEAQRLLYVALTRARDMLILASSDKSFGSKGELGVGLAADVAAVLFPGGFPAKGGIFSLDTGCLVECIVEDVPYVDHSASAELGSAAANGAAAGAGAGDTAVAASAAGGGVAGQMAGDGAQSAGREPRFHALLADADCACYLYSKSQDGKRIESYSSIAKARKERAREQDAAGQAGVLGAAGDGEASAVAGIADSANAAGARGAAIAPDAVSGQQPASTEQLPDAAPSSFALLRPRQRKADTVSAVGSAFHLVAQWIAMQDDPAALRLDDGRLAARIDAAMRRYQLDDAGCERLQAAIGEWMGCELFAEACSFAHHLPEQPFLTCVDGIEVEGFIDLLCYDQRGGKALVVDYKTGVGASESVLRERYALQASVYAYAMLKSGMASRVELVFVHPEAALAQIRYEYALDDLEPLAAAICE